MKFNLTVSRTVKLIMNDTVEKEVGSLGQVIIFRVEASRSGQKQYTVAFSSGVVQ